MRLRTQRTLAGSVGAFIGLSGCASPGDVQKTYDNTTASYESDMAFAREWDTHALGIPAGGWVGILITAAIVLGIVLAVVGYFTHQTRTDRRDKEHLLAVKREETVRAVAERGPCPGCGLDVPTLVERIRSDG